MNEIGMKIEIKEGSSKGIAHKLDHMKRFLDRLGNPEEYRFNGGVGDAGERSLVRCVCGMRIRYMFSISHKSDDSRSAVVGCKCVRYFKGLNPELFKELQAAYEKLLRDIRDRKRRETVLEKQV